MFQPNTHLTDVPEAMTRPAPGEDGVSAGQEVPLSDLLITEKSFYGAMLLHLASLVRENGEPRAYGLEEYLHDFHIEGVSPKTVKALWGGFLEFIELGNERNLGYRLFDDNDYTCFAMMDSCCFFSAKLEFSQLAIELFFKSAEAVVVGDKVRDDEPPAGFRVRPLERVANRIVMWSDGRACDEQSVAGLVQAFANTLGVGKGVSVSPSIEQTIWWAIGRQIERVFIEHTAHLPSLAAPSFLVLHGRGSRKEWVPCASDDECRALLFMQSEPAKSLPLH